MHQGHKKVKTTTRTIPTMMIVFLLTLMVTGALGGSEDPTARFRAELIKKLGDLPHSEKIVDRALDIAARAMAGIPADEPGVRGPPGVKGAPGVRLEGFDFDTIQWTRNQTEWVTHGIALAGAAFVASLVFLGIKYMM